MSKLEGKTVKLIFEAPPHTGCQLGTGIFECLEIVDVGRVI